MFGYISLFLVWVAGGVYLAGDVVSYAVKDVLRVRDFTVCGIKVKGK